MTKSIKKSFLIDPFTKKNTIYRDSLTLKKYLFVYLKLFLSIQSVPKIMPLIFRNVSTPLPKLTHDFKVWQSTNLAIKVIKGAAKLYFMHYSWMVIILFITDLHKSAFSTYSLKKTRLLFFCDMCLLFVLFWTRSHLHRFL